MSIKARRTQCLSKHYHPSISEASYCDWLFARKQNGEILDYRCQQSLALPLANGKSLAWCVDFKVEEKDGSVSWHESKGWNRSDDNFKMKLRMALLLYPGTKFYVNKLLAKISDCGRLGYMDMNSIMELRKISKQRINKIANRIIGRGHKSAFYR